MQLPADVARHVGRYVRFADPAKAGHDPNETFAVLEFQRRVTYVGQGISLF